MPGAEFRAGAVDDFTGDVGQPLVAFLGDCPASAGLSMTPRRTTATRLSVSCTQFHTRHAPPSVAAVEGRVWTRGLFLGFRPYPRSAGVKPAAADVVVIARLMAGAEKLVTLIAGTSSR